MILEGNARGSGAELAQHLMNARDNEHVTLHAVEGFIADDLFGAFAETEAISQATQCQKYLFSLSINPPQDALVSIEAFENAIKSAERTLGLVGQPRAIVFHEKKGRRHAHVVWSRIDTSKMKAVNLPHFKRKLMAVSHALFIEHGWDVPEGFKEHAKRDPRPVFDKLLDDLREGDTFVVVDIDRAFRSAIDAITTAGSLDRRGISFEVLNFPIDTSTDDGEFLYGVLALAAQLERKIIRRRTKKGLAAARQRGVRLGRPPRIPDATLREAHDWMQETGLPCRYVAALLGVDRLTLQRGFHRLGLRYPLG